MEKDDYLKAIAAAHRNYVNAMRQILGLHHVIAGKFEAYSATPDEMHDYICKDALGMAQKMRDTSKVVFREVETIERMLIEIETELGI